MKRVVAPELLDELPADDPAALRSRRDLRLINRLMGNHRWMRTAVGRLAPGRLVELGAGDGDFLNGLDGVRERIGIDLAPRPANLRGEVKWVEGDVLEVLEDNLSGVGATVVCANLFLHHLEDGQLAVLGELLKDCEAVCFSEPYRSRRALVEGALLWPLVNRVTRHDMMASIRAGFRRGELVRLLGLDSGRWEIHEQCTLLGANRVLAWRR